VSDGVATRDNCAAGQAYAAISRMNIGANGETPLTGCNPRFSSVSG
jgi:hypothetical protein